MCVVLLFLMLCFVRLTVCWSSFTCCPQKNNTLYIFFKHFKNYFLCVMSHVFSGAMKEAGRWLSSPRRQLPMKTHGLDWPSTPGQGMWSLTHTHTPFYCLSSSHLMLSLHLPLSYVLECASCGVIYRSRQYWMGNQDPESGVVRSEVKHVWEGVSTPPYSSFWFQYKSAE